MLMAARVLAGAAIAGAALLVMPPAHAGSGITGPASGATITSGTSVTVTATADGAGDTLKVTDPAGKQYQTGPGTALSLDVPLLRNGKYHVELVTAKQSEDFHAEVPPAAPAGLAVAASGQKITATWRKGSEPDLSGYAVTARDASSTAGSCSGSRCSATLTTSATGTVTVTVTANRAGSVHASTSVDVRVSPNASTTTTVTATPTPTYSYPAYSNPPVTGPTSMAPTSSVPVGLPNVAPSVSSSGLPYPTTSPNLAQMHSAPKADESDLGALRPGTVLAAALVLLLCSAHFGLWARRLRLARATTRRGGRKRVRTAKGAIARAEALAKATDTNQEAEEAADEDDVPTEAGPFAPHGERVEVIFQPASNSGDPP